MVLFVVIENIFKYSCCSYLFAGFELLATETVEQKGQEKVEHEEVAHHQCGQEDGEANLGPLNE